ncbi:hypothetical protein HDU81_009196 [Chytriomyces hyalinus]|nr:hypothetical protein HDU81_009196 [Chytriomyces hyalinus]
MLGATTVVPPAYSKWSAPPKSKQEVVAAAAVASAAPKKAPGLLGEVPKITGEVRKALTEVEKNLSKAPVIMELAHLTKLGHLHVLIYLVVALIYVILVACNFYGGFLTFALSVGWPVVKSLRAAESCKKEEVQTWLAYWVITALMTLIEYAIDAVLTLFPFYYFLKMLFVLWLIIPYCNGSYILYMGMLKNVLPPIKKPEAPAPKKEENKFSKWNIPAELLKK